MTNIHPKDYAKLVSEQTPHSRHIVGCLRAFWVGGVICTIGQALTALAETLDLGEITAPMFTSMVLIFLGTTLTGVGVYDRIGHYAGAGSIVPITGFANSVAAPAVEYQKEGQVFGIGSKIFTIAGPVILYGVLTSWVLGLIQYVAERW